MVQFAQVERGVAKCGTCPLWRLWHERGHTSQWPLPPPTVAHRTKSLVGVNGDIVCWMWGKNERRGGGLAMTLRGNRRGNRRGRNGRVDVGHAQPSQRGGAAASVEEVRPPPPGIRSRHRRRRGGAAPAAEEEEPPPPPRRARRGLPRSVIPPEHINPWTA